MPDRAADPPPPTDASRAAVAEPVAKRVEHVWTRPTGDVEDPYAWLRDRDDPDTIAYLEAENAYSSAWFDERSGLIDEVFGEIRSRVQETDLSPPVFHGGWWYMTRTVDDLAYPIHCRARSAADASDAERAEIMLDQNAEAAEHEYFDLGTFDLSPDHRLAAWSADTNGDEHYTLRIRDLESGRDLDDVIEDTTWGGTAWSLDGAYVFYVTPDEQERPHRVWRHRLGTAQTDDQLVFEESDQRFFVGIGMTRSEEWILIHSGSKTSSEQWLLPAADPTADPMVVRERTDDLEYEIDHWGECFVVVTNDEAVDFRVMTAPLDAPGDWTELLPHVPGQRITSIDPFADHLVIHEWVDAQPRLRLLERGRAEARVIDLGDLAMGADNVDDAGIEPHDVNLGPNPEWTSRVLRVMYQSLTTPPTVADVDITTDAIEIVKRSPTPNVDLSRYRARRDWVTAADGTQVPVDIVTSVDTPADGTAPGVLYGYGAYEVSLPPWFSIARLSLLDRGVVWALAHPRGGGELGRQWYQGGKLLNKTNTFTDTLACAHHLAGAKICAGDRLALRGGSAGGLLVGACVTREPATFAAAVAEVPFVDIVTTMSDASLPLTVTEWEEWGDPRHVEFARYMTSYSPYDSTVVGDYPALFVTAGLNDPRVSYHEPAKWVARLRAVRTNVAPLLLRTEMGAGHGGPTGRYDAWRDEARVIAFLVSVL